MITTAIRRNVKNAYGFIADPKLTTSHNANLQLGKMLSWFYFDRPRHLAFHDMTSCATPMNLRSLLGLNLKFCPIPRHTTRSGTESLTRFRKDLFTKIFFANYDSDDEEEPPPEKDYDPALYLNKGWEPPDFLIPDLIVDRFEIFAKKSIVFLRKRSAFATTYFATKPIPSTPSKIDLTLS